MDSQSASIEFEIPEHDWEVASGSAKPTFLKAGDFPNFRPNIVIDNAELQPSTSLADIADFFVEQLRPSSRDIDVVTRDESQTGNVAGLFQAVTFKIKVDDQILELVQLTSFFEIRAEDSDRRWAHWVVMTSLSKDAPALASDYEEIASSIRFDR